MEGEHARRRGFAQLLVVAHQGGSVMDRYAVSVVCPCLDEEANLPLLAERLFVAMKESGITTELVIVDDGSTDGTARVAEELGYEYGDAVRLVQHKRNRGIAASWRTGVDAARGAH